MTQPVESHRLAAGLAAVYIPRAMDARQRRAIRRQLGLECRHGSGVRSTYGRCPACRVNANQESA